MVVDRVDSRRDAVGKYLISHAIDHITREVDDTYGEVGRPPILFVAETGKCLAQSAPARTAHDTQHPCTLATDATPLRKRQLFLI